jgi:sugar phosphate isomerase/epimerase
MTANWLRFPPGAEPEPVWPLEALLDGVAGAGFDAVGIDHYTLATFDGDLAGLLGASGLRCSDVGIVQLGNLDPAAVAWLADTATTVRASLCIAALVEPLSHAEAVAELRAAAALLAPRGIRIAFECTAYGNATRLREAVRICDDVGWERCGLLVDAWHVFRGGESLDDLAALGDGRIALVHLDDGAAGTSADAIHEGRHRRLLPGAGSFDLDGFLRALDAAGYTGPICLEVLSDRLRGLPPREGAQQLRGSLTCLSRPGRASRGMPRRPPPHRAS